MNIGCGDEGGNGVGNSYWRDLRQTPYRIGYMGKNEYHLVKLSFSDILYINGLCDYVRIFTTNSRPIIAHMTMKAIFERLPEGRFMRLHRSYIVAIDKITSVRNKHILINKTNLPIGISYLNDIKNSLNLNKQ